MNPENPFQNQPNQPDQPVQSPSSPVTGFPTPASTPEPLPQTPPITSAEMPQNAQPLQPFGAQPTAAPLPNYPPAPTPTPLSQAGAPQPTTSTEYSADYLNQIAPKEQRAVNRFAIIGLSGGVLIAAVVAVVIMLNAGGPNFSAQAKSIQARISTLQKVADAEQPNLKESAISEANSSLSSALTSMNTDLTTLMKTKGLKVASGSAATITKGEKTYADALQKKLDDSYQRGTLDRTYTTQMTYELTLLRSSLVKLKNTANSKSVTAFSTSAVTNIDAILKAYNAFSATK